MHELSFSTGAADVLNWQVGDAGPLVGSLNRLEDGFAGGTTRS